MSHKDNLRDPSRRARVLARREVSKLHPIYAVNPAGLPFIRALRAKLSGHALSRSKYQPHFGAKQRARLA